MFIDRIGERRDLNKIYKQPSEQRSEQRSKSASTAISKEDENNASKYVSNEARRCINNVIKDLGLQGKLVAHSDRIESKLTDIDITKYYNNSENNLDCIKAFVMDTIAILNPDLSAEEGKSSFSDSISNRMKGEQDNNLILPNANTLKYYTCEILKLKYINDAIREMGMQGKLDTSPGDIEDELKNIDINNNSNNCGKNWVTRIKESIVDMVILLNPGVFDKKDANFLVHLNDCISNSKIIFPRYGTIVYFAYKISWQKLNQIKQHNIDYCKLYFSQKRTEKEEDFMKNSSQSGNMTSGFGVDGNQSVNMFNDPRLLTVFNCIDDIDIYNPCNDIDICNQDNDIDIYKQDNDIDIYNSNLDNNPGDDSGFYDIDLNIDLDVDKSGFEHLQS
ncbi:MAG: hypothetical protein LBB20_01405 [Puniceicoccales bacterium]|jgi:hypothetical protein|nr:hypothetical protein [Puniceicoccales bacterium]